jgi:hypothetical protein
VLEVEPAELLRISAAKSEREIVAEELAVFWFRSSLPRTFAAPRAQFFDLPHPH